MSVSADLGEVLLKFYIIEGKEKSMLIPYPEES